MKTTLNLDDELLERARRLTGITEPTALVHEGLRTLVRIHSAQKLAALGGSQSQLKLVRHRRSP